MFRVGGDNQDERSAGHVYCADPGDRIFEPVYLHDSKLIPTRIRIIVQLVVVASLVAIVDQFLKAYAYDVSKQLAIFIGLIITNCIVMGRLEAFALGNGVWKSFLDGVGNAAGYGWILIVVAFVRELFGSGELWGIPVIPQFIYDLGYADNGLMLLSPMALIVVGVYMGAARLEDRAG